MNYAAAYVALVTRAKSRQLAGYAERHHINPVCLGGGDSPENIVELTAREHYLAHLLLVKMHPNNGRLAFAAHMMTLNQGGRRPNNRRYEWLRRAHAAAASRLMTGNKNKQGRKVPEGERAKISASNKKPKSLAHKEAMSSANRGGRAYSCGTAHICGIAQRANGAFVVRRRAAGKRVYVGFYWSLAEAMSALGG